MKKWKKFKQKQIIPDNLLIKMIEYVYDSPNELFDHQDNDFEFIPFDWLSSLLPKQNLWDDHDLDFVYRSFYDIEDFMYDKIEQDLKDEASEEGLTNEDDIDNYVKKHFHKYLIDMFFANRIMFVNKKTHKKEYYTYYHDCEDTVMRTFDNFYFSDWTGIYDYFLKLLEKINLKEAYEKQDEKVLETLLENILNKKSDE